MKVRDHFNQQADTQVKVWAKRNANIVWLGADSRKLISSEIANLLMEAYKLGKEKAQEK
jgi:hypothetical protein